MIIQLESVQIVIRDDSKIKNNNIFCCNTLVIDYRKVIQIILTYSNVTNQSHNVFLSPS